MAGPLFLLFNLSIVIVWLIERTQPQAPRDAGKRDRRRSRPSAATDVRLRSRLRRARRRRRKNLTASLGDGTAGKCWANFLMLTGGGARPGVGARRRRGRGGAPSRGCSGGSRGARRGPDLGPDRAPVGESDPALTGANGVSADQAGGRARRSDGVRLVRHHRQAGRADAVPARARDRSDQGIAAAGRRHASRRPGRWSTTSNAGSGATIRTAPAAARCPPTPARRRSGSRRRSSVSSARCCDKARGADEPALRSLTR